MKKFIFICIYLSSSLIVIGQNTVAFLGLEIDRLVVKSGNGTDYIWEWDDYVAQQWGLEKKSKKIAYESFGEIRYLDHVWWTWRGQNIVNTQLTDGSFLSEARNSSYLNTSVNLHPQWLDIIIKNNSYMYAVVDLSSSLYVSFSYPESNLNWGQERYRKGMGSLFHSKGSYYPIVIIPPGVSVTLQFYTINWIGDNRYNIIAEEHLNGSRVDINLRFNLFRNNPLTTYSSFLKEPQTKGYYTVNFPKEVLFEVEKSYYEENGAYFIYEDNAPLFDGGDLKVEEQIICKLHKSNQQVKVKENAFGLLVFADNVESKNYSSNKPSNQNNSTNEPKNNLGLTYSQLKNKFPNLRYYQKNNSMDEYESDGIIFTLKNGKVVCEYTQLEFIKSVAYNSFLTFVNKFRNTNYTSINENLDSSIPSVTFRYSYFTISFVYWNDGSMGITYQSYDYWK